MTTNPSVKEAKLSGWDILALAVIASASIIGINQYTYGLYNHFITIPFIKSIIDPSLYPHDYLIAEKKFFYTYFNTGCAWLINLLGISLPQLYFTLYCISLYVTLISYFKISLHLFPKKEVAYFSVIFLIFSFTTLGEMRTVESLFLERTLVLPLLLFAFYCFLQKKIIASYTLAGIAFLFHPLSAVYALACLFMCSLFSLKEIGWKQATISLAILGALASPVLWLKIQNPAPSLGLFNPDPEWIELLRLRSAHHLFPTTWSPLLLTQSALFIVGFGLSRIHKPATWEHKTIMLSCSAVLLMCVAGTLFTEVLPVSIVLQFQLFRSFVFLIFFAIIYYSNFLFEESRSKEHILKKSIVFIFFVFIFYSGNMAKYASFLLVAIAVVPGYYLASSFLHKFSKLYFPSLILMVFALGAVGGLLRGGFTIGNKQDSEWLEIQYWAKQNTPKDAVFIVPPRLEGFRVEAERTLYGDWKDGTQMFFNPQFGKEWIRRMKMLGYVDDRKLDESYAALKEPDFEKIKEELTYHSAAYIICKKEQTLSSPMVFSNREFKIYKIK